MEILDRLGSQPVLPILNFADRDSALRVTEALVKGGIRAFEITLRSPQAMDALQTVRKEFPDLALGAGTILEKEQLSQVNDCGIDFVVSPGWSDELWVHSQELELLFFPGILTPSELTHACQSGCRALKVFPIEPAGGISYLNSLIAPFRSLNLNYLPTGGISREQVEDYLAEDSVLTVGGSWLTPRDLIVKKEFDKITELASASLHLSN